MTKVSLICVGRLKDNWWINAQAEYLKRLKPFLHIDIMEVSPEPTSSTTSSKQSMRCEGERILKRISERACVIALERTGRELSSEEIAKKIEEVGDAGRHLIFVIGGSEGLDDEVLGRANFKWSLSKLTFLHEMARIITLEQIYRSQCIVTGKKYHK